MVEQILFQGNLSLRSNRKLGHESPPGVSSIVRHKCLTIQQDFGICAGFDPLGRSSPASSSEYSKSNDGALRGPRRHLGGEQEIISPAAGQCDSRATSPKRCRQNLMWIFCESS